MGRKIFAPSSGNTAVGVFPVRDGGTASATASAALNKLGGVAAASKDVANGVAGLDADGRMSISLFGDNSLNAVGVMAEGLSPTESKTMPVSGSRVFLITNYDSQTQYTLSAIGASTVTRSGKRITYTSSSSTGVGGFVLNGKTFNITHVSSLPRRPTLAVSLSGSKLTAVVVVANTGTFANEGSGSGTHASTDWQIGADANFSAITYQSLASSVSLTSLTASPTVTLGSTYFVRARHRDAAGNVSAWSQTKVITVPTAFYPVNEETSIQPSDLTGSVSGFSRSSVAVDNAGTRIISGALGQTVSSLANAGAVYVSYRNVLTWSQEAKITPSDPVVGGNFGYYVACDANAQRIAIGAPSALNASSVACGAVYIFTRSGTTWTQEAKLVPSDGAASDFFGSKVSLTFAGDRLVVGAPGKVSSTGAAYIFTRSGTTWTQEAKITASDSVAGGLFGYVSIARTNGDRMIVGSYGLKTSSGGGVAYIFTRSGTTWTQEAKLVPSIAVSDSRFGYATHMDDSGVRVVTSIPGKDTGYAVIYSRSGTTWTQEAIFPAPDGYGAETFGHQVVANSDTSMVAISAVDSGSVGDNAAAYNGLISAGAVYVLERSGTTWTHRKKLYAKTPQYKGFFGSALAATPDFTRLIVGSSGGYTTNPFGGLVFCEVTG